MYIKENESSTIETEFKEINSIVGITSTSNTFLIQETTDERYELLFGDGIFGKKLESNNIIRATYIKTDGKEGNGASTFNFVGAVKDENGAHLYKLLLQDSAF